MINADIAIIIIAFNRPLSLKRILESVYNANYTRFKNITLYISIDFSGNDECQKVAEEFDWKYGDKKVICHNTNLGLKKHILSCGDLTENHDGIIMLEDDLIVAPSFYNYSIQAYSFYRSNESISGIGLYNYVFNEYVYCPFRALDDGYDNYFVQIPCSWGQLWTKKQWYDFKEYFITGFKSFSNINLPPAVLSWSSEHSWKKYFYCYMIEQNKYFVQPRISYSTNYGESGANLTYTKNAFQSNLNINSSTDFIIRFSTLDNSLAIYDAYFELSGLVTEKIMNLKGSVEFDLYNSKPITSLKSDFVFTLKKSKKPISNYATTLYPLEINILQNEACQNIKNSITFSKTTDILESHSVNRVELDFERFFVKKNTLIQSGRNEVCQTKEYKLGLLIFRIIRILLKPLKIVLKK